MATPNYSFEKRQKELAKKRKKEERLKQKSERKSADSDASNQAPPQSDTLETLPALPPSGA